MKQLKHYGKTLLIFFISSILLSLLLGVMNYFGLLQGKITQIIIWIYMIFFSFYAGLTSGKLAEKNGYLEGIKIGGILILLLLLCNLIFFASSFSITRLAYYFIIFIVCIASSMLGINKKKN